MRKGLGRYFILLLLLCGSKIHAQTLGGNAVFSFLRQPVGARTWALGGNNISSLAQDLSLAFQQPALLRPVHNGQISSSLQSLPAGINNYSLVAATKIPHTSFMSGIGVNYFDYGSITQTDASGNILGTLSPSDFVVQAMVSKSYKEKFNIGATLKFIHSNYGMFRSSGIALDVGLAYTDSAEGWQASMVVKNMGTQLTSYTQGGKKEELPFEIQAGISKRLAHAPFQFSLTAGRLQTLNTIYNDTTFRAAEGEINYTGVSFLEKLVNRLTIGVQIYPHEKLELMAGYHFQRRRELNVFNQINGLNGFTFGTALKLRKMHFMYATGFYQRNLFHQLTVNINWKGVL
ncbi:MAG: type IX secretion system protein PorQ [Sediminibacterium sp.]